MSARSTEASGLDERTLWANEHDVFVIVIANFHNTLFHNSSDLPDL